MTLSYWIGLQLGLIELSLFTLYVVMVIDVLMIWLLVFNFLSDRKTEREKIRELIREEEEVLKALE